MELTGKYVLITGASAGIGAEFARQLHALGAKVTLIARREQTLKSMCEIFNKLREESATYVACDLSEDSGIQKAVAHILGNRVDILINNAGFGSFGRFENLSLENELKMVKLNIVATMHLARAVIPLMKARRSGTIVSVSSVAGFQPLPFMATYSGTKAFNYTHSLALRYELQSFGIQVLTVCPGPTATEFQGVSRIPGTVTAMRRDSVEQVVKESIQAMQSGKAWLVPCLRSKLLSLGPRFLPKSIATYFTGKSLYAALPEKERV